MSDRPMFVLGKLVATPGALAKFEEAGQQPMDFLARHAAGDWGDLGEKDRRANDIAIAEGARLLSAYRLDTGTKIWIITEADRSSTCIFCPRNTDMAVEREVLDWGVRLTARPFTGANAAPDDQVRDCRPQAGEGLRGADHLHWHVPGEPLAAAGRPGVERRHGRHHQGDAQRGGGYEGRGDEG